MNGFLFRFNGTEIHVLYGRSKALVGYLETEDGDRYLGLGFIRIYVATKRKASPIATAPSVAKARDRSSGKCLVCGEAILEHESTVPFDPGPLPAVFRSMNLLVHSECWVYARHGRVGCQRDLCPNCDPPAGQSIREQARDAEAFYKASNGRPRKRGSSS